MSISGDGAVRCHAHPKSDGSYHLQIGPPPAVMKVKSHLVESDESSCETGIPARRASDGESEWPAPPQPYPACGRALRHAHVLKGTWTTPAPDIQRDDDGSGRLTAYPVTWDLKRDER